MDLPRLARQNEGFERFDMAEIRHKKPWSADLNVWTHLMTAIGRYLRPEASQVGLFQRVARRVKGSHFLAGHRLNLPPPKPRTKRNRACPGWMDAVAGTIERDDPSWGVLDHSLASAHRRKRCASARASANKRFQSSGGCPLSSILRNTR